MYDPDAIVVQSRDRLTRAFLDWIGNADEASHAAVHRHEHDGLTVASELVRLQHERFDGEGNRLQLRRALVIDVTDRIVRRNFHPADGIEDFSWRDGGLAVRVR